MDHTNYMDTDGSHPAPVQQHCTAEHLTDIILVLSALYCDASPIHTEQYMHTCQVLAYHLSDTFILKSEQQDITDLQVPQQSNNLVKQKLMEQLQCLHDTGSKLEKYSPAAGVNFTQLATYIESKQTLESLARILHPLTASR